MGTIAEQERLTIKQRQAEGIAAARAIETLGMKTATFYKLVRTVENR